MARKTTKNFKIGDTFLTWKVVRPDDTKKYKYICQCTECGVEKSFNKYNLLKGAYAPCKKCGHAKIKNSKLIKKHWNCELNRTIFTKVQDFSLTQSYWFICPHGHNFKSNIKDFSLDRCLSCKNHIHQDNSRVQTIEYAYQYFKSLYYNVYLHDDLNLITIEDIMVEIVFNEDDRFTNYRNYYSSENELLKDLDSLNNMEQISTSQGYTFYNFLVNKNLKNNVDNLKKLVVQWIQRPK